MKVHTTKRWIRLGVVSLCLGLLFGVWATPQVTRADEEAVYFASTGHTLDSSLGFLQFWRTQNGAFLLGAPVTEPLVEDGLAVQYFERGRLELHARDDGRYIERGRVGAEYSALLWRSFEPAYAEQPNREFFAPTGHSLGEPFLAFWGEHGGLPAFGYPISEPLWEYVGSQMTQVQYFERGRLEYRAGSDQSNNVQISPLGRELALLRGISTERVEAGTLTTVTGDGTIIPPTATPIPPTPTPAPPTPVPPTPMPAAVVQAAPVAQAASVVQAAPVARAASVVQAAPVAQSGSFKRIVVDLSDQWVYAYEGDVMVYDAPTSTGKNGFNTPVGNFSVYAKLRSQTMSGTLQGEYYNVPNVPHVMYINGGVALHGTYWHNLFGTGVRRSHGCINLPLNQAAWLYNWAPLGTPVQVRW